MKTNILRSGAFGIMLLLSGAALGNSAEIGNKDSINAEIPATTLEVKIFPRTNGVIAVNFKKQSEETVEVKIFTLDGDRIYKEKISENEIVSKRYDLSKLPDGNYYVEVSNDFYLVRQLVEKQN